MRAERQATRILVIDENDASAAALVSGLADAGYAVAAAHGTTEAIRALQTAPRDLAILSIAADGMSGPLALAGMLRQQFDIPLVFISALADAEVVAQATALGALAFLVQPQDARQCLPSIQIALARAEELRRLRQTESQFPSAVQSNRITGTAVGILIERLRLDRTEAFEVLRAHGRSNRRSVTEVAEDLVGAAERVNAMAQKGGVRR